MEAAWCKGSGGRNGVRRGTPEHWMFPVPAESYGALGAVGPDDETLLEGRRDAGLKGEHVAVSHLPHAPAP